MRRLLHLLLVFAVLLCGSQLAEPAEAESGFGQIAGGATVAEDHGSTGERAPDLPDAGHHHCPVAPDPSIPAVAADFPPGEAVTYFSGVAALRSLSRAPPLDPPTA